MCLVGLVGCQTKLRVVSDLENVKNRQKDGQPLEGIVYYLPSVKLGINATWTLVDCPSKGNPKVQFTAEVTEEYVADRSRQFFIDYESFNAPLKNTDMKVSLYPNGTLRSINGETTSQISDVVTSALEVAKSTIISATGEPVILKINGMTPHCHPDAEEALERRRKLRKEIKSKKINIADILIQDPASDVNLGKLQVLKQQLQIAETAHKQALERTSFKQRFEWTPPEELGDEKCKPEYPETEPGCKMSDTGRNKLFIGTIDKTMVPSLCFTASLAHKAGSENDSLDNPGEHLIYRIPNPNTLEIKYCNNRDDVFTKALEIPQLGQYVAIPFESRLQDKTNMTAEFADNGALTNFTFYKSGRAKQIAEALAKTAGTVKEIVEARKGHELKRLEAETELLKAKAEKIKAERELQELQGEETSP